MSTPSSQKSKKGKKVKKKTKISYKKKKKRGKKKFVSDLMPLMGWLKFLKDCKLLTPMNSNGISIRDATIIFVYSKMGIVEEVVDRFLYTHMDICAFYEGLGRIAE